MQKEKHISFSVRLPETLYNRLVDASWENRTTKTKIIILSLEEYLKFLENKK